MIDTHSHLQFQAFEGKVDQVIKSAKESGVEKILVVGTNLETSKKAVALAEKHDGLYASIGIHPHHVFNCHAELVSASAKLNSQPQPWQILKQVQGDISKLEALIPNPKVIAIGETGLDRHIYEKTHYQNYEITEEFMSLQKLFFKKQIQLAIKHQKSLIIHNRQAVPELLEILKEDWSPFLEKKSVFHCCEPDQRLLDFALKHNAFIGIDGDITYDKQKQDFLKKIPLELIVLETDSPYFTPQPLKSSSHSREGGNPTINEPKNLKIIAEFIATLKNLTTESVIKMSSKNSSILFKL